MTSYAAIFPPERCCGTVVFVCVARRHVFDEQRLCVDVPIRRQAGARACCSCYWFVSMTKRHVCECGHVCVHDWRCCYASESVKRGECTFGDARLESNPWNLRKVPHGKFLTPRRILHFFAPSHYSEVGAESKRLKRQERMSIKPPTAPDTVSTGWGDGFGWFFFLYSRFYETRV